MAKIPIKVLKLNEAHSTQLIKKAFKHLKCKTKMDNNMKTKIDIITRKRNKILKQVI